MDRKEQLLRAKLRLLQQEAEVKRIVGQGYDDFWEDKHRYRVLKGGRGSKKSTTTALWFIYNIMKYKNSNAVCVRKTYNTHKDSTFAQLKWATRQLGVFEKWKFTVNPMECVYEPTGQKILFRGFDDVLKLTSLTVDVGVLCWAWLEETYEIDNESEFDTLDETIRGEMPNGLWKQLTLTYNPWVNSHWTKKRFFDNVDPLAFTLTTTHKCNEYMDQADHDKIEMLQYTNPDRYNVVGLGEYGIPGGTYFDEFRKDIHVIKSFVIPEHWNRYTTKDYGLDMLANYWIAVDTHNNEYVYKELYESDLIISAAAKRIREVNGNDRPLIKYAPPDLDNRRQETGKSAKDIFGENGEYLTRAGNDRVDGALAIKEHIKVIETKDEQTGEIKQTSRLRIFDNCVNLIRCLPQIQKDESNPNAYATEPHELTHSVDALRYYCIMRQTPTIEVYKKRDDFFDNEPQDTEELTDSYINMRVRGR
jgi:phage terminase large subunit